VIGELGPYSDVSAEDLEQATGASPAGCPGGTGSALFNVNGLHMDADDMSARTPQRSGRYPGADRSPHSDGDDFADQREDAGGSSSRGSDSR
jgi:hypothetical protein